jgi:hypothetical protein
MYPVEVVVAEPTPVQLDCTENAVYTVTDDIFIAAINAPVTIHTELVRSCTIRAQLSV